MSSRYLYQTNNASTPIRSGPLPPPLSSVSTINPTSRHKNVNEANKYSNSSPEFSRYSKYEAGSRHRSGSRTSDDIETTKRSRKRIERKKKVKRHIKAWSGDERNWETTRECNAPLGSGEKGNFVQIQKTNENVLKQKVEGSESIFSHNCDDSCDAMYLWEKPHEVVRDHAKVIDDVEAIFHEPLPRGPDPCSQKKNDIPSDDPQLIHLDDDIAYNDILGDHAITYPAPMKSKDGLHKKKMHFAQKTHTSHTKMMMETRHEAQENNKKVNKQKKKKPKRQSSSCKTATIHGGLGKKRPRIYDTVSCLDESSDDEVHVFQWDWDRGEYIRFPVSPVKSIGWGIRAHDNENEKNELWDHLYRQYKETLPPESNNSTKADGHKDHRAEQKYVRSRRKINQAEISAGRKNDVSLSRSQRKSKSSNDVPELLSSLAFRESSENQGVNDNDLSPTDHTIDVYDIQSYAADHTTHENREQTSEVSAINWRSRTNKKSLQTVIIPDENFASKSTAPIDITVDSSENNYVKQAYKRRRANNFDLSALETFATDIAKKLPSNHEPKGFFFENQVQEQRSECYESYRSELLAIQAVSAESVEQYRSDVSTKMATDISEKHGMKNSRSSSSKVEGKLSYSSDENTSRDSEDTLIVDHSLDPLSQSIETVLDTILEETNDERFKYKRKRRKYISSSSSTSTESRNSNCKKPKISSTIVLHEGVVKKCSSGRWQVNELKDFKDDEESSSA